MFQPLVLTSPSPWVRLLTPGRGVGAAAPLTRPLRCPSSVSACLAVSVVLKTYAVRFVVLALDLVGSTLSWLISAFPNSGELVERRLFTSLSMIILYAQSLKSFYS